MGILFSCWMKCLGKGDYTDTEGLIQETSQDDYSVDEVDNKQNEPSYNAKKINQKSVDEEKKRKDSFINRENEEGNDGLDEVDNKVDRPKDKTEETKNKLEEENNKIEEANIKIEDANNRKEAAIKKDQTIENINLENEFNTNSESILDSIKDDVSTEDHKSNLSLKTEVDLIDFFEDEDYSTLDKEPRTPEIQTTIDQKNNLKNLLTPSNVHSMEQENVGSSTGINGISSPHHHNGDGDNLTGDGYDHIGDDDTKQIESAGENHFVNETNSLSNQIDLHENNKNLIRSEGSTHVDSNIPKVNDPNLEVNFKFYENENKIRIQVTEKELDLVTSEKENENSPLPEVFIKINKVDQGRNNNEEKNNKDEDEERESCQRILETRTNGNFLSIGSEQYDSLSQSCSSISSTNSEKSGSNDHNASSEEILLKEKKAYFVAKEIMSSENVYVNVLKLLNVTFREFVQDQQQKSVFSNLSEIDFNRIFSNLADLLILNESLLNDFVDRVQPESWNENKKISDVIVRKGPFLKIYSTYISKFSDINKHFENCCHKNPKFDKIVKEFEAMPICQNLKLQHYLLKPVQRLPQYKLLLQDYLKQQEPHGADYEDTLSALKIVSNVADHANEQVKQEDKMKHLLELQSRLGNIELLKAGRYLIKEGEVQKISRKDIISTIYLVLLSDCLLYTKYQNWAVYSSGLWVAHTIDVSQMEVSRDLPGTDIFVKNNVKNFTFRTRTIQEKEDWLEALAIAKEGYRKRSGSFSRQK